MDEFKFNFNDSFFYENNRTLTNLDDYKILRVSSKANSLSNNLYENANSNNHHRTSSNNFYLISMVGMFMIGLITNTINLIILTRKPMKSITNRYLCALALCDLFVLVFSILSLSNSFINTETAAIFSLLNTFINESSDDIDPSSSLNDLINSTSDAILSDSLLLLKEDIVETNIFKALLKTWSSKIFPRIYPFTYPLGKI